MNYKYYIRKLKNKIALPIFLLNNINKEKFTCPVCDYTGAFMDFTPSHGARRKHAKCPKCGAFERHRLQYLVVKKIFDKLDTKSMQMLHFAPETFFRDRFSKLFGIYETADLDMQNVDFNVDIQNLPFADEKYDFVFASHVLEHIPDDEKAISEIRRVLKPNGFCFLPVPIVSEKTIEYPEPNPNESFHVRAPGIDYFSKYEKYFSKVETIRSNFFSDKYQLYIYEKRDHWPSNDCPLRTPMEGEKHFDVVPICYV